MSVLRWASALLLLSTTLVWGQAQLINGNRVHAGWVNYGLTTGTATAYVLTFTPALPGYVTGQCFLFTPHANNTGSATVNVNALGAKSLKKWSAGAAVDLTAGDLLAGRLVSACYDGTNLQVMSFSQSLPNVTNDAQLKRAAGDFSTFTGKATPVGADVVLVEDSEAAGAKKAVTLATLPGTTTLSTCASVYMNAVNAKQCRPISSTAVDVLTALPGRCSAAITNNSAAPMHCADFDVDGAPTLTTGFPINAGQTLALGPESRGRWQCIRTTGVDALACIAEGRP